MDPALPDRDPSLAVRIPVFLRDRSAEALEVVRKAVYVGNDGIPQDALGSS